MTLTRSAVFWLAVLVLGIFTFAISFGNFVNSSYDLTLRNNPIMVLAENIFTFPIEDREAITFVGDIMLARNVEKRLKEQPAKYAISQLNDILNTKFLVGNFEGSIPTKHIPTKNFAMKFSVTPELLGVLSTAGFTHLSLANNHTFDYGAIGYKNTAKVLEAEKFSVFGHPNSITTNSSISYIKVDDRKVAVISINATYGYPSKAKWSEVIEETVRQSEFQVVYIHWGNEYELVHSSEQETLARNLVDAGADLIVGHHPHVVQDIEQYKNALIFYSLGNFIFDQYFSPEVQEGLVIKLKFDSLDSSGAKVLLYPVETKSVRLQPREIQGYDREKFLESLAKRSSVSLGQEIKTRVISLQF